MKFKLEESLRGASDETLLDDLRRCARALGRETITIAEYEEEGRMHPSSIQRRFGSWPKALELAGLQPSRSKIGITDDELFENIKSLWISLGRQPRYSEVKSPTSRFSAGTYENRFESWSKALGRFVEWVNAAAPEQQQDIVKEQDAAMSVGQVVSTKRKRSMNTSLVGGGSMRAASSPAWGRRQYNLQSLLLPG